MFSGTLLPYQVTDVAGMASDGVKLVAYEMGLGKTPMTIAAVEDLRKQNRIHFPTLVIALSSLKYQWQSEVYKFTDSDAIVINGTPTERAAQWEQAQWYEYVVLSYNTVITDWKILEKFKFDGVVIDEATAIKSFRSKRSKAVKALGKRCKVRFALTGTPMENGKPEEVYSIMQFVDPTVLGRFDYFDQEHIVRNGFGGVQYYQRLPQLQQKLAPAMVRKRQEDPDVAPYLPEARHREPLLVKFDAYGQKLYDTIADSLIEILKEIADLGVTAASFNLGVHYGEEDTWFDPNDPVMKLRGQAMSRVSAILLLAAHPELLVKSAEDFDNHTGHGSAYASDLLSEGLLDRTKLKSAPKFDAALKFLQEHLDIDPSYKGVVFTKNPWLAEFMAEQLTAKGYKSLVYTGKMNPQKKEAAKVEFQKNSKVRLLISTDAGGYGVDLPQANLLFNYDQPWQSGLKVQRNSRVKRASSKWKVVTIQDILARFSIEEHQFAMLNQKTSVSRAVIDGSGINSAGGVDMDAGSLLSFLIQNSKASRKKELSGSRTR
jgi:SNF2 family DNA or RNA helicase